MTTYYLFLNVFDESNIQLLILLLLCSSQVHSGVRLELVYDSISVQTREATNSLHYRPCLVALFRVNSAQRFLVASMFHVLYIHIRVVALTNILYIVFNTDI